ncbi:DUF3732 domain-containing protein [Clostridium botulinum]|uniref:DUF3732 domain-containing protein n=1 Tax=unclassified Clostridium TaxID=2614128 RepID=UPI0005018A4A|nr:MULTISPECIES: DUF3732 domain-containing protein [unclassified Clostridium]KFX55321.1 hypothetical protein KU40_08845 [Clostridium botulinum]MBY6777844.1 DUF3732 domain-containing protein [Clostridium botulinum]MBY6851249.1 DUF3732 domain-containing protein [Clostridium botulinum]MBY7008654.1 DUF3732 domain-containing protein [Clostridium botulinum]NFF24121.1 DUF3732 domain-containing protein [Clostridium botulinum]
MKFYFDKIMLWTKNGNIRKLNLKPNGVNIITGESNTGKTTILNIIEYCFFSSENIRIPERIINENTEWYGIRFYINGKLYTVCRAALDSNGNPSDEYYFSGSGDIPLIPIINSNEKEIKGLINYELSIDENVVIPYGGKKIRAGSKVSARYFMLFNSQDENTIINTETFFNRQTDEKYKEALDRIFDLALGISTPKDVTIKAKLQKLNNNLRVLEKKQVVNENREQIFKSEIEELVKLAKNYNLLAKTEPYTRESLIKIKQNINSTKYTNEIFEEESNKLKQLQIEKIKIKKQIKNLKEFKYEYEEAKKIIGKNKDSLLPITYLKDNYDEIIESPLVKDFIVLLEEQLRMMSKKLKEKKPMDFDYLKEIKSLELKLRELNDKINIISVEDDKSIELKNLFMVMGELNTKIDLYLNNKNIENKDYLKDMEDTNEEIEMLEGKLSNRDDLKIATIRLLEKIIQIYLDKISDSLDSYGGYEAVVNYKNKRLELQEPKTTKVTHYVGSSSNILFLHLCMFLGLHELFILKDIPYIMPYIALDQPSRPYYDNATSKMNDRYKITQAIKLLNDFVTRMNEEYSKEFQVIVVEHIPKEIWNKEEFNNIYLVDEFYGDNKLIRVSDMHRR